MSLEQIQRLATAERLKRDFAAFVKVAWPIVDATPLKWGPHLDAICLHLQAVADGRIKNLLINVPPGHAKSMLTCVLFPAWMWTHRPSWRYMSAAYAAVLARRDAVKTRTLIESPWYRETFDIKWALSEDQNTKDFYQNNAHGYRVATSVGASATGHRVDCILIDDPLNAPDAHSKPTRDTAIEWIDGALSTRFADPAKRALVMIMQRLHEEDPAGHVLRQGGYDHLCLAAEFDPDARAKTSIGWEDPRTEKGQLLFPELFTAEALEGLKATLGPTAYAGQFQQRPTAAEGGMFKRDWWRFWRPDGVGLTGAARPPGCSGIEARILPAKFSEIVLSVDCSFKGLSDSDFVGIAAIGRTGAEFWVLDLWLKRAGFTDTIAALRVMAARWPNARRILVEDKANGSAVIDSLKAEIPGILAVNPQGGKEARAAAIQPSVEAGQVYLPEGASWLTRWVDEFAVFPNGRNDDLVDVLSQALIRMLPSRTSFAARFAQGVRAGRIRIT